jgi:hypothetical protein
LTAAGGHRDCAGVRSRFEAVVVRALSIRFGFLRRALAGALPGCRDSVQTTPDMSDLLDLAPAAGATAPAACRKLLIRGVTIHGRAFRPRDWAERLCGVLACYRPGGVPAGCAPIGYSPYARPVTIDGTRYVVVDERLREIEPRAWEFVLNFARDNELPVFDAGALPAAERK